MVNMVYIVNKLFPRPLLASTVLLPDCDHTFYKDREHIEMTVLKW